MSDRPGVDTVRPETDPLTTTTKKSMHCPSQAILEAGPTCFPFGVTGLVIVRSLFVTKKLTTIVTSGLLFLMLAADNVAAYYLPFLQEIPEGSVGVFRNGDQLYDGVYTSGVYPVWPSDELLLVSILPETAIITAGTCLTADGVSVEFGAITVAYRVLEGGVWMLVELFGVDFVAPLIDKPVQQGLADWCANMTAEDVFLEKNGLLKQHLMDYLTHHLNVVQGWQKTGLLITGLEISHPSVPDEVIDRLLKRRVGQEPLAAEDLAGNVEAVVVPEASYEEGKVASDAVLSGGFDLPEQSGFEQRHGDDTSLPQGHLVTDPPESQDRLVTDDLAIDPEPSLIQDDGTDLAAEQMDFSEQDDSVFAEVQQDRQQSKPVSKSLWKNNSSRLYLGW